MKRAGLIAIACAIVATASLSALGATFFSVKAQQHSGRAALSESYMAQAQHDKLVSAIEYMCGYEPGSLTQLVSDLRTTGKSFAKTPTQFQVAALDYSEELKNRRIKLDDEIKADRMWFWWFQIGIVVFGGLATIMVGLKPLCEKMNISFVNTAAAAFAIIFSAVVTSLSSLSAIAAGQADLLHQQRTLAQLQQLHWRISNDVFAATKLCLDNSDLEKVGSWKDRFEQIANEATPIIAQPGDLRTIEPVPSGVKTASRS